MKKLSFSVFSLVLSLGLVSVTSNVFAQFDETLTPACPTPIGVKVLLSSETPTILSGLTVPIKAVIKNENNFPVSNGTLLIKISRNPNTPKAGFRDNGEIMVDRFVAAKDISVGTMEEKPVSFDWHVPSGLISGNYTMSAYVLSADEFNLGGLESTNSLRAGKLSLKALTDNTKGVFFDESSITVADKKLTSGIRVLGEKPIVINARLINTLDVKKTISLVWKAYRGSGVGDESEVQSKLDLIELLPRETKTVSFTLDDADYSLYKVIAEAEVGDSKSFITIPILRAVDEAIIQFIGAVNFPMRDSGLNIFGCLYDNKPRAFNDKLINIVVKDDSGVIVAGASRAFGSENTTHFSKSLDLGKRYNSFSIEANVSDNDGKNLGQKVIVRYDCSNFGEGTCSSGSSTSLLAEYLKITLASLIVVILLIVRKRQKKTLSSSYTK